MFDDSVLLITGGTGSFGNTVLRRFLQAGLREIRISGRLPLKRSNASGDPDPRVPQFSDLLPPTRKARQD